MIGQVSVRIMDLSVAQHLLIGNAIEHGMALVGNSVAVNGSSCVPVRSKWEYALLPMWLLSYQARNGERYLYAINGYTGKLYGSLPISHPKLLAASAGVFAGVAALITLIGGLLF